MGKKLKIIASFQKNKRCIYFFSPIQSILGDAIYCSDMTKDINNLNLLIHAKIYRLSSLYI